MSECVLADALDRAADCFAHRMVGRVDTVELTVTGPGCGSCGAGVTQTAEPDAAGHVTRRVSQEGRETTFSDFDARGNPQTVTEAPGLAE